MKKNIYLSAALLVLAALVSCQKTLLTYQEKPDVYFNNAVASSLDTTLVTFSLSAAQDSVLKIIVNVTGGPTATDRAYSVMADPASTAVAAKHYDALPTNLTIKRNKVRDTLLLRLHRTPDLLTATPLLILNLVENENFATEMKDKVANATTGRKLSYVKYSVYLNDIVKKPGRWLDAYFGTFTRKKLLLICNYLNITPAYLDTGISVAETTAYSKVVQRYLNAQATAGNTLYEDDGTVMAMGVSAQ